MLRKIVLVEEDWYIIPTIMYNSHSHTLWFMFLNRAIGFYSSKTIQRIISMEITKDKASNLSEESKSDKNLGRLWNPRIEWEAGEDEKYWIDDDGYKHRRLFN